MNASQVEIIKTKELRGNIIAALYINYGEDITLNVLKNTLPLSGFIKDSDIKNAIYYLGGKSKEYVKLVLDNDNYMQSRIWLTPVGINLAERDIKDVGVLLYE